MPKRSPAFGMMQGEVIKQTGYKDIPIGEIRPNPEQARKLFDEGALEELAESIKTHGILQPIVVKVVDDSDGKYEIVAGERRYRAAKLADLQEIPAIIKDLSDDDALEAMAVENLQRKDLTLAEEIESLKVLQERSNASGRELAKRLGKPKTWVLDRVSIGKDPEIMARIRSGELGFREARSALADKNRPEVVESVPQWDTSGVVRGADSPKLGKSEPRESTSSDDLGEYTDPPIDPDEQIFREYDDLNRVIEFWQHYEMDSDTKDLAKAHLRNLVDAALALLKTMERGPQH